MADYTCAIRSSQFAQTNDRSWNLAKYRKLLYGKEDALTAESRLCVVINTSRRCLSVLSGRTTLEEMSLIGSPTPVVKTRDNEVFFCLLSREGSVLSKFRIKFFTTLDRCSFTALLSNYIEVIPVDGNRTGRTISQSTSENDWNFLYHSQTQSQRENLSLSSCSQSNTSTYASMQSLSTRNTCSQNTTQRSLVSSAFSSQSSQMISQSIDAFPQNTSAFSQPFSVILQPTTDFSSSPSSDKSRFSVFSKSGNLDEENERASQPDSTLFNTKKSSVVGTPAADIESRRSGIHNAEFNNTSSMASRQHCDGDVGSLQIVPDSIVDSVKNIFDESGAVEGTPRRSAVGSKPFGGDGNVAQSIIPSRVDAATQTSRQLTIDDLLKDDEILRELIVKRLNDPAFIAFQRRFSTARSRRQRRSKCNLLIYSDRLIAEGDENREKW